MLKRDDFLGSWRLRRVYEEHDGRIAVEDVLGSDANGCIHYLDDGRMAVLIQYGGSPGLPVPFSEASDSQIAAVARRFFAYAGTYSIHADRVVHHLDTCSNPADIGADFVRLVEFAGSFLTLATEPEMRDGKQVQLKLQWESVSPRQQ